MFYPIYIFDPASYIFGLVLVMVVLLFIYADEGNINNINMEIFLFRYSTEIFRCCLRRLWRWDEYNVCVCAMVIVSQQTNIIEQ